MDKVDKSKVFKNNQEVIVGIVVDNKFSLKEKRVPFRALFKILTALPTLQKVIPALD